jgi:drug/metabolite transporter (DMT)-like permease
VAISFRLFEALRPSNQVTQATRSLIKHTAVSPLLLVLGAAILWSTGGLFIKATSLSAIELSFGRSLLAAITIAIVTRREGFGLNRISAVTSILYAALLILFVLATKLTTAANAIFLQYTAPVYVLILEPLFYKEKFRSRDLITVAACVGGMSLFFVGKLRPQDVNGNLLALASGVCFALFFLLLRHSKARDVNRASSAIYGNLIVVLICAPAFFGAARRGISASDLARISYLGIIQIGCAYLLFTLAMARGLRSLDASIIGYIEPVLNPVWVFLFIGERPSGWAIVGGAIIIASVLAHMILSAKGKRNRASVY